MIYKFNFTLVAGQGGSRSIFRNFKDIEVNKHIVKIR